MTEKMIYELAWNQQINIWGKEKEMLDQMPDNEITQMRERNAWGKLQEIEKMMAEKGYR